MLRNYWKSKRFLILKFARYLILKFYQLISITVGNCKTRMWLLKNPENKWRLSHKSVISVFINHFNIHPGTDTQLIYSSTINHFIYKQWQSQYLSKCWIILITHDDPKWKFVVVTVKFSKEKKNEISVVSCMRIDKELEVNFNNQTVNCEFLLYLVGSEQFMITDKKDTPLKNIQIANCSKIRKQFIYILFQNSEC